ncbi:hypothetical protein [Streptomyces sp. NPDC003247]|uniref:hypothetical protein n=1 Tax=Streptomyces sp. NPDC003247 TaxID=3364677 RepID=UPI0036D0291A
MYVLVPDDPVFFARFQSLEEPLLRRLHRLHVAGRESDDERVICDAYDSWVQILLQLPLWCRWHGTDPSAAPRTAELPRYVLYDTRGHRLTSLHPVELTAADLGHLTACLDLFVEAERARRPGADRDDGLTDGLTDVFTDVFRRVMEVLLLPPPDGLLGTLRDVASRAAVVAVTLPEEQETEYRRFCEEIVTILSSGDTFAYRQHRAMYL